MLCYSSNLCGFLCFQQCFRKRFWYIYLDKDHRAVAVSCIQMLPTNEYWMGYILLCTVIAAIYWILKQHKILDKSFVMREGKHEMKSSPGLKCWLCQHYTDVIMSTIASQITSLTIVYSTLYSDADQRNYQSSASLAFLWGIHRRPVDSPHKWPVTRKMFPFDDVIMKAQHHQTISMSSSCDTPMVTILLENVILLSWKIHLTKCFAMNTSHSYHKLRVTLFSFSSFLADRTLWSGNLFHVGYYVVCTGFVLLNAFEGIDGVC